MGDGFCFVIQAITIYACRIRVEFSWCEKAPHWFSYITLSHCKSKPAFASPMIL